MRIVINPGSLQGVAGLLAHTGGDVLATQGTLVGGHVKDVSLWPPAAAVLPAAAEAEMRLAALAKNLGTDALWLEGFAAGVWAVEQAAAAVVTLVRVVQNVEGVLANIVGSIGVAAEWAVLQLILSPLPPEDRRRVEQTVVKMFCPPIHISRQPVAKGVEQPSDVPHWDDPRKISGQPASPQHVGEVGLAGYIERAGELAPGSIAVIALPNNKFVILIRGIDGVTGTATNNRLTDATQAQLMQESAYSLAIRKLISTLPPGADIMLVGHSQGGIAAADIARHPDLTDGRHITHVLTAGSPVDNDDLGSSHALSLKNSNDPVAAGPTNTNAADTAHHDERRYETGSGINIDHHDPKLYAKEFQDDIDSGTCNTSSEFQDEAKAQGYLEQGTVQMHEMHESII